MPYGCVISSRRNRFVSLVNDIVAVFRWPGKAVPWVTSVAVQDSSPVKAVVFVD